MNAATTFQSHAENYLDERRRLGYRLRTPGNALRSFARYVDALGHEGPLTVEIMVAWARRAKTNSDMPATWARRLKLLRPFARYLQQFDPHTEVPDDTLFGGVGQRLAPNIYSEQEILDLLAAAHRLDPPLRGVTYETLFGLLAATGLRVSEAVHLTDADVDLNSALLSVRQTKFAKSRQLPIHPSTVKALARYRKQRERYLPTTTGMPFLIGSRGRRLGLPLGERQAHRFFTSLRDGLDWVNRGGHDAPRLHNLRHTFAVRRLVRWYASGVEIDQKMLALSTYMGHAEIFYTYWYLTAVPELMAIAAGRFEQFADLAGDDDA
jgi:integrase